MEESELMRILKRRKHLSEVEDNCDDDADEVRASRAQTNIAMSASHHANDSDPELEQDNTVNLRQNNRSHLYGLHPRCSRDSYSSLNSRLSALSNLQSSFSSNSDCELLLKKNSIKLRPKDSILITSNSRRRKKLFARNISAPDDSAHKANTSFLWSRGVSVGNQLRKTNSTTSTESNNSEDLYYSIDDSDDKTYEELSNSLDNIHINESSRNNELINEDDDVKDNFSENIYESIQYEEVLNRENINSGSDEEVNAENNEYASIIYTNEHDLDYDYDSKEFGYEQFDNNYYHSNRKLVSAINKNVKNAGEYSSDIPVHLNNEDESKSPEVDEEKYDRATIASDDYGSDHYEDVESGLKVVSSINECFQNEGILFKGIPTDPELDKYQRRLRGRVNELVQTEIAYVSKLDHVVNDYKDPLKGDGIPLSLSCLLPDQIFSNIEELRDFHKQIILPALQEAEQDLVAVGKAFKDNEILFKMYVKYSRDNKKCIRNVIEHKHFFHIRQLELGQRLDLSSYLLEPIQRVPRYRLFLEDLIKTRQKQEEEAKEDSGIGISCRNSIASYGSSTFYENLNFEEPPPAIVTEETGLESLHAAKNVIDKLLRKIDDTVAIENIRGCPMNLREQGELLRQDEFVVIDNTRRRIQMRCFLFEYTLILTTINRKHVQDEVFEYHDSIYMSDLGITPPPEEECASTFTIWYKNRKTKPYIMDSSVSVKKAWVKDISALLWEQARRDKELLIRSVSRKSSFMSTSSKSSKEISSLSTESEFVMVPMEPVSTSFATRPSDSSLRGVPGEMRRRRRKTTWYIK